MFLLPTICLGVVFALLLGGRPARLLEVELRHAWTVGVALAVQLVLFSPLDALVPGELHDPLHVASYAFLSLFVAANVRHVALVPLFGGVALNAAAIVANGGRMPVAPAAAAAAGIDVHGHTNVELGGSHLTFLGDIFALPSAVPLANAFSVGDLLIGIGMILFIVAASFGDGARRSLVPARLLEPLRTPAFRRLAAGKLVSHLGDWLTLAALVGWIYQETDSLGNVAVLMLVRLAPPILGGGVAAAVVDRLPKRRLLVGVEAARGLAVAGALAAVGSENLPLAFATLAVSGALAAIAGTTVPALVPSLLREEELAAANAGLAIAQDAAMALGALAAGIALTAANVAVALVVDLGTFALAAALFWGLPVLPAALDRGDSAAGLRSGLRHLAHRRVLLVVISAFAAATVATGLVNATLPRFLGGELGLGAGAYGFGLSALACGLVAGEATVGLTKIGATGGRWIGIALLVMAGLFTLLSFTEHAPTAVLLLAMIGFVDGTTDVLFDTIVQRESDPRYLGRIFGLAGAAYRTTMMGAVAAAPLVNHLAAPHRVVLVAGIGLLAASAVALAGTRGPRPAPVQAAEVGSS